MKKNHLFQPALLVMIVLISSCKKNIETKPEESSASIAKVESVFKEEISNNIVSNVMIPFDQNILVALTDAPELVHFTGQLHLITKFLPPNPIQPGDPCHLFTNVISLQGIGMTSGLTYQIAGSFESVQNVTAGSSFQFEHAYSLLPPNPILPPSPIIPGDPCRFRYTVDISSSGAVLEATAIALPITIAVIPDE
jgi:hypothetical protein